MTPRGFDQPLYVLPFDHRASFQTGMFGWRDKKEPREAAVAEIARRYREFVDVFENARAAASAA